MSVLFGRRSLFGLVVLLAGAALAGCDTGRNDSKPMAATVERHSIFFAPDSADLDQVAKDLVARLAMEMKASPAREIMLESFANRTDAGTENRPLAQRRADAVRRALEGQGIDPKTVSAVVVGQTDRIGPSALEGRRVDITIRR
ncbi:MAG: OmpA family protein [Alphaproteobacteria bacterium]|nr:OmpA family protein [Alphaproteobacteria bacterium]